MNIPEREKIHQNGGKLYLMTGKLTKWPISKLTSNIFPLQDPPKFTQNGIFCLKIWQRSAYEYYYGRKEERAEPG
jgi:hypothetical protein